MNDVLKKTMLEKIISFAPINEIKERILFFKKISRRDEKRYFENMSSLIDFLFIPEFDLVSISIEFKPASFRTIKIFTKYYNRTKCKTLLFLIELIEYKLSCISGINNLA